MAFSYKPLWCMLTEKGISKTAFREKLGLSTATLAKLSANKPVSSEVLARICEFFGCGLENVVEYVSNMKLFFINISDYILGYDYTIYIDRWPECRIKLQDKHFEYLYKMNKLDFKELIFKLECAANEMNFPNAGIIGTTKIKFDSFNQVITINGSFAVTENLLLWLIQQV